MADVTVYGADWCPTTKSTRTFLDEQGIMYEYVNIDHDRTAAKWVMEHNNGKEKKPTLDIKGQVLSVPSEEQLTEALKSQGIIS